HALLEFQRFAKEIALSPQTLLRLLSLRNIGNQGDGVTHLSFAVQKRENRDAPPDYISVRQKVALFHLKATDLAVPKAAYMPAARICVCRMSQIIKTKRALRQQVNLEQASKRLVVLDNVARPVRNRHRKGRVLEQGPEALFARFQFL